MNKISTEHKYSHSQIQRDTFKMMKDMNMNKTKRAIDLS